MTNNIIKYDAPVAKFVASGSYISCLAVFAVLVFSAIWKRRATSLRRALLLNLFIAEFAHYLATSISGFIFVDTHQLLAGSACAVNGFFAQLTAQTIDFTVLALAATALLASVRLIDLHSIAARRPSICAATWLLPVLASLLAAAKTLHVPTGDNWCTIPRHDDPAAQPWRLALVDGWRMAILFLIPSLYASLLILHIRKIKPPTPPPCRATVTTAWHRFCPRPSGPTRSTPNFSWYIVSRPEAAPPVQTLAPATLVEENKIVPRSEFSLPIQGPARSLDKRTESIFRWVYVRHPGLIGSLRDIRSPLPRAMTAATTTPTTPLAAQKNVPLVCPWEANAASKQPAMPPPPPPLVIKKKPPPPPPPKVTRSYAVSVEASAAPSTASSNTLPQGFPQSKAGRGVEPPRGASTRPSFGLSIPSVEEDEEGPCAAEKMTATTEDGPASPVLDSQHFPPVPVAVLPASHETASIHHPPSSVPTARSSLRWPLTNCVGRNGDDNADASKTPTSEPSKPHRYSRRPFNITKNSLRDLPLTSSSASSSTHSSLLLTTTADTTTNNKVFTFPPPHIPPLRPEPVHTTTTITSMAPATQPLPCEEEHHTITTGNITTSTRRKTFLLSRSTWSDSTPPSSSSSTTTIITIPAADRETRRMLLVGGTYVLAYFMLWLPWLFDTLTALALGNNETTTPRAMAALRGLGEYFGVASALAFTSYECARRRANARKRAKRTLEEKANRDLLGHGDKEEPVSCFVAPAV